MKYKVVKIENIPYGCVTTDELDKCLYYVVKRNNFSYIVSYANTYATNVLPISLLHQTTVNIPLKQFIELRIQEGCKVYGFNEVTEVLEFILKEQKNGASA